MISAINNSNFIKYSFNNKVKHAPKVNPFKTQAFDSVSFTGKKPEKKLSAEKLERTGRFNLLDKAIKDLKTDKDELELIQEIQDILTYEPFLASADVDYLTSKIAARSMEKAENDEVAEGYLKILGNVLCNYYLHPSEPIDTVLLNAKLYTGEKSRNQIAQLFKDTAAM